MELFDKRFVRPAAILLLLSGTFLGTVVAQTGDGSVSSGEALYLDYGCYQCHGYEGQGTNASPPVPRIAPTVYPYEAFAAFLRTPVRLMPAYSQEVLSDSQIREIYDFISAIPEPPAVEDIPVLRDL